MGKCLPVIFGAEVALSLFTQNIIILGACNIVNTFIWLFTNIDFSSVLFTNIDLYLNGNSYFCQSERISVKLSQWFIAQWNRLIT